MASRLVSGNYDIYVHGLGFGLGRVRFSGRLFGTVWSFKKCALRNTTYLDVRHLAHRLDSLRCFNARHHALKIKDDFLDLL